MERDARLRVGHRPHSDAVGLHRLRRRALRHPRPVRRLPGDNCWVRGEHTGCWAVYCEGVGGCGWG